MSELSVALLIAIRVHCARVDKQGEPYLYHIVRVVEAVSDEAKVVAALHDVLEDSPSTPLTHCVSPAEMQALVAITREKNETYASYIQRVSLNPLAREVKLADLQDNLRRTPPSSLRRRYEKAIEVLVA